MNCFFIGLSLNFVCFCHALTIYWLRYDQHHLLLRSEDYRINRMPFMEFYSLGIECICINCFRHVVVIQRKVFFQNLLEIESSFMLSTSNSEIFKDSCFGDFL